MSEVKKQYFGGSITFEQYLQNASQMQFIFEAVILPTGQRGIRVSHPDGTNLQGFSVSGNTVESADLED